MNTQDQSEKTPTHNGKAITMDEGDSQDEEGAVPREIGKSEAPVGMIVEETEKFNRMMDFLTSGGRSGASLSDEEKQLRSRAFDVYSKRINDPAFIAFQFDEDYVSLTNAILTEDEIQGLLDNFDTPVLLAKAGDLSIGFEIVRDVQAARRIVEYINEHGTTGERIFALRFLADFWTMSYIGDRDVRKAIPLYSEALELLRDDPEATSDHHNRLNFGWCVIGLAQCQRALEQPEREEEMYEVLGDYLRNDLGRDEEATATSLAFAKAVVSYRESLPRDSGKLLAMAEEFERIASMCGDDLGPVASKSKGISKELRRMAERVSK